MAATQEDSFREIQLSGKALVFVFMAGVVILVTVFLMGLLVGRGVLATRGPAGAAATTAAEVEPPAPPAAASGPSSTSPATAGEKLSYAERLGSAEPAKEPLKAAATPAPASTLPTPKSESPASAPPPARSTSTAPAPAAPAAASTSVSTEPGGAGFAIQVAALREKDEADVIVKRLAGKGYPAYVVGPAKGAPSVFRVRVGKYKERHEADTVAARLQKEEQFKPWIVR